MYLVKSKIFPLQSRYDSWQTGCELGSSDANEINQYGANLTTNFFNLFIDSDYDKRNAAMHHLKHNLMVLW